MNISEAKRKENIEKLRAKIRDRVREIDMARVRKEARELRNEMMAAIERAKKETP